MLSRNRVGRGMSIKENYLTFTGRIGRLTFLWRVIISTIVCVLISVIAAIALIIALTPVFLMAGSESFATGAGYVIGVGLGLVVGWPFYALTTKRARDIGLNAWATLAVFIGLYILELVVLSRIPGLIAYEDKALGIAQSWVWVIFSLLFLLTMLFAPADTFKSSDGDGGSDADPVTPQNGSVPRTSGVLQPKGAAKSITSAKPQFGTRGVIGR
jgi:uncharacterized membrane protein YhaH (DUF805 family)